MSFGADDLDQLIGAGREERSRTRRRRARAALGVSFGVLVVWLVYVTAAGQWGRVADHWASALTMVAGSFVAGSTPQGGGAVAFPVFTKVLSIDTSVARTFSLCIQTVGMTAASLSIIIQRRTVEWRAVAVAAPVAVVSFLLSAILLGDGDAPFWPSRLPGAYVKVTFTLIVAAMAVIVWLGYRVQILERVEAMSTGGPRIRTALVLGAVLGGLASSLTGSGADVIVYLVVVVVIGLSPKVGVPTSVIVMTCVSIAGFVLYGLVDGQLSVTVVDGTVTHVGGDAVAAVDSAAVFGNGAALPADRFDLFGLWLAAAPVVAFGAPLGAWVSSLVTDRQLVRFVVGLAVAETVSTIVFLDGLLVDPDPALIAYAVIGGVVMVAGLNALKRNRRRILGLPGVDTASPFTRERLDVGARFRDDLDKGADS